MHTVTFNADTENCCDDCATIYVKTLGECPCCSAITGIDRIKRRMRDLEVKAHNFDLMIQVIASMNPNVTENKFSIVDLLNVLKKAIRAEEDRSTLAEEVCAWRIAAEAYVPLTQDLLDDAILKKAIEKTGQKRIFDRAKVDLQEIWAKIQINKNSKDTSND